MWRFRYVVESQNGERFPVDMLRYDASYPASGADAHKVEESFDSQRSFVRGLTLVLAHLSPERRWHPTFDRWASFGWRVIDVETPVKCG